MEWFIQMPALWLPAIRDSTPSASSEGLNLGSTPPNPYAGQNKLKSPVRGERLVTPDASRGMQKIRIFFKLNRSPRWG
jgi:hypothetical protein